MDNTLSKYCNFDQIGGEFVKSRGKLVQTQEKMNSILDEQLKPERENLENAVKRYNDKAKKVMESKNMKTLSKQAETHSKSVQSNLMKAQKEFLKIREDIMKQNWSEEKKNKQIQEVYQYILQKLYTKEDMDKFKNMMNDIIVMVTPNGMSSNDDKYHTIEF
tara:strand:+ start:408 stop:893 length:486 start_codon:yes stop_codon:yes gene_type:complete